MQLLQMLIKKDNRAKGTRKVANQKNIAVAEVVIKVKKTLR
jgi:hypothetical protein